MQRLKHFGRTAFKGRIVVVTQEDRLPYDRPQLTKDILRGNLMMPLCRFDLKTSTRTLI